MATVKKASKTKVTTAKKSAAKKAPSKKAAVTIECGKWEAWHDFMPGKAPTLYVTGTCRTSRPGYRVTLVEATPQGKNPKILLLRKVIAPSTKEPDTTVNVRFTKKTKFEYTHVTILPEIKTIKVKRVV